MAAILLAMAFPAAAGGAQPADLKRLSIEELMQIDVTITARREEPVGTAAAAVSVVTGDDIRRAGVTTIADALWLADGVHVARVHNGSWAISARGFNVTSANKLLVMVDGRTVYSPLFTGVFWNTLDYVLDDIDRIEVIRGPGAALWGANAVNGVVNIITRQARDTQGTYAAISGGPQDRGIVEMRHGAAAGTTYWRVYGKFADRAAQRLATGASSGDARQRGQVGFRIDGGSADFSRWMLKGDAFHSRDHFPDRSPGEFTDLGLQGRWSQALAPGSRVEVQTYYRREYRRVPAQLTHSVDIVDTDLQHVYTRPSRHDIVWGGGLRLHADRTHGGPVLRFEPDRRTYTLASLFAQDDVALWPARFYLTLGAKYEHNSFSGGEIQPNVRARLLMARDQVLWGAVSRAVRRPTRLDTDSRVFGPQGDLLIRGSDTFQAESLVAYELGYRIQPSSLLSVEATLFRHDISDLRSQDLPPEGPPIVIGNSLRGHSSGVELSANLQPGPGWRTRVSYTRLTTEISPQPGSRDVAGGTSEGNDPRHLFRVSSAVDLPHDLELNATLRAVGPLPNPPVPGYAELTLRLGWFVTPRIEVWGVGANLLHDRHPEFGAPLPTRVEFERTVRAGLAIRY